MYIIAYKPKGSNSNEYIETKPKYMSRKVAIEKAKKFVVYKRDNEDREIECIVSKRLTGKSGEIVWDSEKMQP